MIYREDRQVRKRRRRDPKKCKKRFSDFIDFSSIFHPKIDPGTIPRTNNGKNGKTRLKILVFLGSGENFGRPEVSGRFQRPPKSHFLGVQKAGRKKGRKPKQNWGQNGAARRNARGLREVRRVKTLRVLQGSVRTLHQLWISAGILQELCRVMLPFSTPAGCGGYTLH